MQLRSRLKQDAIRWLPAVNRDPKGQWPDEPGALLIDCGLEYARALGQRYAQNAMLALDMDAIPRLVTL